MSMQDLTNEQLVELIQSGNGALMGELYSRNTALIRAAARRLVGENDIEDAMQDAYFGLVNAVNGYKAEYGYKFMTYAEYHIKQAIRRGKSELQPVPEWLRYRARRIHKAEATLYQELNRAPTARELADECGLTPAQVRYALKAVLPPVSSETALAEDLTVADTIADENVDIEADAEDTDARRRLRSEVDKLPERERHVIRGYYFRGMTYKAIGAELNISIDRVRQIRNSALKRLKTPETLQAFVGYEVDAETLFYRHRGVQAFKNTRISTVEQTAIYREYKAAAIQRRLERELENEHGTD